jgi:hypothetical protein
MSRVSLIERHEWGAKPPMRGGYPNHPGRPNRVTIHHVGGSRAVNWRGAKTVLAIQRIHQEAEPKGRGWPDGGYHVVIDPYGGAWRMNPYHLRSNHAGKKGWNNNSRNIGISLYGNYETGDVITDDAYATLVMLLADICEEFDIDPVGSWQDIDGSARPTIMGHNENGGVTKACPGRNISMILPRLRRDVDSAIEGARAREVSRSLTKPVQVRTPALRAQVEVGMGATPIVAIIAIVLLLIRMREGK